MLVTPLPALSNSFTLLPFPIKLRTCTVKLDDNQRAKKPDKSVLLLQSEIGKYSTRSVVLRRGNRVHSNKLNVISTCPAWSVSYRTGSRPALRGLLALCLVAGSPVTGSAPQYKLLRETRDPLVSIQCKEKKNKQKNLSSVSSDSRFYLCVCVFNSLCIQPVLCAFFSFCSGLRRRLWDF